MSNYLITGGAGYIGSVLTGLLLQRGHTVVVLDKLLFGGESLLGYWHHPCFKLVKGDVLNATALDFALSQCHNFDAVIHLAALVGFPACHAVGRTVAWAQNVEATESIFRGAEARRIERFVFASTYSNYGASCNGELVTESSPLYPKSLYAETKIAAEQYLLERSRSAHCAPIICRFATLFGISPRIRFDLIINQLVLEAVKNGSLIIYQRDYSPSLAKL